MAITHVGSNTQDAAGALSLTFTIPGGAALGDFMICFVKQSENTTGREWDDDGGGGNGWIRLAYNRTTGGRDMETAIYYKTHDGSESNPTFTWASGVTTEPMSGMLEVYRGSNIQIVDFGYANAQNDANPPNPTVDVPSDPQSVVVFHGATHDDISAVAAPTGYTLRSQVWNGTADDHRNVFSADLLETSQGVGSYTPPDWQHSVLNTTPEYHTYTVLLKELTIGITDQGDEQIDVGDVNEIITGFGFEAVQGTGTVELGDSSDYGSATLVTQTIDSWSDTSIQFDAVLTGFVDGTLWVFVTNDSGDISLGYQINFGNPPYSQVLNNLGFDIIHGFNNSFADDGTPGSFPANGQVDTSPNSFKAEAGIPGANSHAWGPDSVTGKVEMADTSFTNLSALHQAREICGWYKPPSGAYKVATVIWEEGGGVNNLYMALGPGNALFFNVADSNGSPAFKAQAFADFTLTPGRWYHILGRWEGGNGIGSVELWIDGIKQAVVAGDIPITDNTFSTHSGDYSYGDADGSLDTGGTDISYSGSNGALYAWWATASTTSNPGSGIFSDTERRVEIFGIGAPATDSLSSDTEANMQIALDAIAPKAYSDVPLALNINRVAGFGDLSLDLDSVTFDSQVSCQVRWLGVAGEELTLVNNGTSNFDPSNIVAPYGGTVVVQNPATLTVTGVPTDGILTIYDNDDDPADIQDLGATLQTTNPTTGADVTFGHSKDGDDIVIQFYKTGFKEVNISFILTSADQSLDISSLIQIEDNL